MDIEKCIVSDLPRIMDPRGNLTFVQSGDQIQFPIKRIYYLYDVPGGSERGGHAHKEMEQLLIAMSGSFDVILNDGRNKKTIHLNRSYKGLYIAPMIWRELNNFSSGAVCMAVSSTLFSESDYIRDLPEYIRLRSAK